MGTPAHPIAERPRFPARRLETSPSNLVEDPTDFSMNLHDRVDLFVLPVGDIRALDRPLGTLAVSAVA